MGRLARSVLLGAQSLAALGALWLAASCLLAGAARAGVVYSNDFETNTDGFDIADTSSLPIDDVGGVSTYLGIRTPGTNSAVLTVTGLSPGTTYHLVFDLYLGGTWDGSVSFGPDSFSLATTSGGTLVDATFRNGFPIGDPAPVQSYSDATPLGDGGLFRTREGADVELGEPIYYFGHGDGNPTPSFAAGATTETITFQSVDAQGITDEFFALDNVVVTSVPEPPAPAIAAPGLAVLAPLAWWRRARTRTRRSEAAARLPA